MSDGNMNDTQRSLDVSTKLRQIAEKAKSEPHLRFTSLAHLLNGELLTESYQRLKKHAAAGVDGQTWHDYAKSQDKNLSELHERLRTGRFRALPVRRVRIGKEDGSQRDLGIPSLEDKIVQRAVVTVLEAIYETDFHPCSYGFRPGKSAWQALDALRSNLQIGRVNYVLDADIKKYFDSVVKSHLMDFMRKRVADSRLLQLVGKWLKAGVIDEGRLLVSDLGTPQGAVISPLLANIYLHHVLDDWWYSTVLPKMKGNAYLIRYADDFVMGFQYKRDAERVAKAVRGRLAQYGLELHEEKTRLIPYGKFAANRKDEDPRQPGSESFDFLGFTHVCCKNHVGRNTHQVRTMTKRLTRFLNGLREWCKTNRHRPLRQQHKTLSAKLSGHFNYYGRRTNSDRLQSVFQEARRIWHKWLNRRSQRHRVTWGQFCALLTTYPLPRPRLRETTNPTLIAF